MHNQVFVVNGASQRLDLNHLVIDLAERTRVRANEQELELFLQTLLLVGRGFAPTRASGQGGHAAKIDVLHQLAVDQLHDLVDVAALDAFVAANRIQSFVRNAFDKSIGCLIGRPCTASTSHQAKCHEKMNEKCQKFASHRFTS